MESWNLEMGGWEDDFQVPCEFFGVLHGPLTKQELAAIEESTDEKRQRCWDGGAWKCWGCWGRVDMILL